MTTRTPEELEEKLHYHFKNKELLITALTHSSYANESKTPTLYNERLEFLGDSVLSVVVANYLFHHSTRPEGELSRMRASLVSEDALFQFAQEIDLGSYLRLGRGEELGGGRCRPSVVSDAFEATIAALFLDGGIETARNFILPFITEGKTSNGLAIVVPPVRTAALRPPAILSCRSSRRAKPPRMTTRPPCRKWCRNTRTTA